MTISLSQNAINRVLEIQKEKNDLNKFLRLTVKSGGCSGFQYIFELDDKNLADDLIIYQENQNIIAKTDEISKQNVS